MLLRVLRVSRSEAVHDLEVRIFTEGLQRWLGADQVDINAVAWATKLLSAVITLMWALSGLGYSR